MPALTESKVLHGLRCLIRVITFSVYHFRLFQASFLILSLSLYCQNQIMMAHFEEGDKAVSVLHHPCRSKQLHKAKLSFPCQ
mmetsp:Transcript_31166/g.65735  ORF Transcript_31166/g.65735 Transcript_31166/m.65735 type:complete len:82 (-) Transcript_31166:1680-1925(-)